MLGALWLAMVIDHFLGEPARWLHPVVGMGAYLSIWQKRLLKLPHAQAFGMGLLAWSLGAISFTALAWGLQSLVLRELHPLWAVLSLAILFKPMLAWRMLRLEVLAVQAALALSLHAGRERLSWLVSRDVSALSEIQVREAAIESLAENLNDSVLAPLFWFVLLGLPGAALYRFANTADAMWGYRGPWEWAGKWAAWADDVLSWVPARITAALMFIMHRPADWGELRKQAGQTPSPNSGWPMAAMALRLGVVLEKSGVYVLNRRGRAVLDEDLHRAVRISRNTAISFVAICSIAIIFAIFSFPVRFGGVA